jgi:uncharacterized membrane protein YgcG
VPFGPGARSEESERRASVVELSPSAPVDEESPVPSAQDFWGEGSAAIHDAVQPPEPVAPEGSVDPPAVRTGVHGPGWRRAVLIAACVVTAVAVASVVRVTTSGGKHAVIQARVARSDGRSSASFGSSVLGRVTKLRVSTPRVHAHTAAIHRPERRSAPRAPQTAPLSTVGSWTQTVAYTPSPTSSSGRPQSSSSAGGSSGASSAASGGSAGSSSTPAGPVGAGAPFGPGHLG